MTRIEHDFIGDLEVPANAYYGVQSLRGKENFYLLSTQQEDNHVNFYVFGPFQIQKVRLHRFIQPFLRTSLHPCFPS